MKSAHEIISAIQERKEPEEIGRITDWEYISALTDILRGIKEARDDQYKFQNEERKSEKEAEVSRTISRYWMSIVKDRLQHLFIVFEAWNRRKQNS